ncbi:MULTISPECIES: NAD(+)/NADH kinase [unclassified Haladaptatus]|uniref:NAD(+)/NADH kinase n=1 Tax=unclassified Haladaptatus TaxID=2622732 RepID=UPI0023E8F976|nr:MULTISPECIES: NAD(+)/NADH kinase [unclassified Haladaptatus]
MRVGIVGQRGNPRAASLTDEIRESLLDIGVTVWVDHEMAAALDIEGHDIPAMRDCDLVVSIGGDGTFLFAARGAEDTPVVGVNLGEVGFLNAVSPEEAVDAVLNEVEPFRETGEIRTRSIPRLQARGDGWELPPALNEVVVQGEQRGHGQGLDVEVRIDGSLYTGGHADGVLVSTPTGSTAYNLSEGGPLVHPSVSGLVVTEMCATEPMPPLVTDLASEIDIRVDGADTAVVISDGRTKEYVTPPATISVTVADTPMHVAGPPLDFFKALGKLD